MKWKIAAAILLAVALPASATPVQYAIGMVKVKNGNPIRGVGDVIFQRSFGPGCSLQLPSAVKPLSTALGASTGLEIVIISCPGGAPPPAVDCRMKLGDVETRYQFLGSQQVLPIVLPDLTGVYRLSLTCDIDEEKGEPLTTTLYLTYQQPTYAVTTLEPPPESWYQRACTWAAGIGVTAPKAEVPQRILRAMYSYGQRNWRYGYCKPDPTKNICVFEGDTEVPKDQVICSDGDPQVCKCPWNSLIRARDPCNFANCFTFSEVLQFLSGVMGVGGLGTRDPRGARDKGFATQPWLRSFDPRFPGNLLCGSTGVACSYAFDVHSLRELDSLLYDATFGAIYSNILGLIGQSVLEIKDDNLKFRDSQACYQSQGYGQWPFYREAAECPKDVTRPASFSVVAPRVAAVSTTGDARPQQLAVDLEVEVRRAGSYAVRARLLADGRMLAQQAAGFEDANLPEAMVTGPPGRYPVRLLFSGDSVARAAPISSLVLAAALSGAAGIADALSVPLPLPPPEVLASFGEQAARFGQYTKVQGKLRVTTDSEMAVEVEAPLYVRNQETFILEGRLAHRDETVAYACQKIDPQRGEGTVTVDLRSAAIEKLGRDGNYTVTLVLHRAEPLSYLDSVTALIELSLQPPVMPSSH